MSREAVEALVRSDRLLEAERLAVNLGLREGEPEWFAATFGHVADEASYRRFYADPPEFSSMPEGNLYTAHGRIARFAPVRDAILRKGQMHILDLGCTDGWALFNLAPFGARGVGVDLNAEAIRIAAERAGRLAPQFLFIQSAIEDLDLWTEVENDTWEGDLVRERIRILFGAVIISEVLEHVLDPVAVLAVAARHLAPGGTVYITVPATPIPCKEGYSGPWYHLRVFTKEELLAACTAAGLSAVEEYILLDEFDDSLGKPYQHHVLAVSKGDAHA